MKIKIVNHKKIIKGGDETIYISEAARVAKKTLKFQDLRRECILRGLSFKKSIEMSAPDMGVWFLRNFYEPQDINRVFKFDTWHQELADSLGWDVPPIKLSVSNDPQEEVSNLKGISTPKPVQKATKEGDTKKSLTYRLTKEGNKLPEIIEMVREKFPEANSDSIKVWHRRAIKGE